MNLGFLPAVQPCDIADIAEGLCDPNAPTPTGPTGQPTPATRPPGTQGSAEKAKAWMLEHSTELLIGAAALSVLLVIAGGRRR